MWRLLFVIVGVLVMTGQSGDNHCKSVQQCTKICMLDPESPCRYACALRHGRDCKKRCAAKSVDTCIDECGQMCRKKKKNHQNQYKYNLDEILKAEKKKAELNHEGSKFDLDAFLKEEGVDEKTAKTEKSADVDSKEARQQFKDILNSEDKIREKLKGLKDKKDGGQGKKDDDDDDKDNDNDDDDDDDDDDGDQDDGSVRKDGKDDGDKEEDDNESKKGRDDDGSKGKGQKDGGSNINDDDDDDDDDDGETRTERSGDSSETTAPPLTKKPGVEKFGFEFPGGDKIDAMLDEDMNRVKNGKVVHPVGGSDKLGSESASSSSSHSTTEAVTLSPEQKAKVEADAEKMRRQIAAEMGRDPAAGLSVPGGVFSNKFDSCRTKLKGIRASIREQKKLKRDCDDDDLACHFQRKKKIQSLRQDLRLMKQNGCKVNYCSDSMFRKWEAKKKKQFKLKLRMCRSDKGCKSIWETKLVKLKHFGKRLYQRKCKRKNKTADFLATPRPLKEDGKASSTTNATEHEAVKKTMKKKTKKRVSKTTKRPQTHRSSSVGSCLAPFTSMLLSMALVGAVYVLA